MMRKEMRRRKQVDNVQQRETINVQFVRLEEDADCQFAEEKSYA